MARLEFECFKLSWLFSYFHHPSTFIWDWVEDVETDWASYDWTEIPATQVNAYSDAQNSSTPWKFTGNMAQVRSIAKKNHNELQVHQLTWDVPGNLLGNCRAAGTPVLSP